MSDTLFAYPLFPVGSVPDAEATLSAARERLAADAERVTVLYVVKQTEGGMDSVPVDAREEEAEKVFQAARDTIGGLNVSIETELAYGSDIVAEIFDVASARDASAIVFSPRKKSWLVRLLSGDTSYRLITQNDRPVVVLSVDED